MHARDEPRKAKDSDDAHRQDKANRTSLRVRQRTAARSTRPAVGKRRVGLRRVHAKGEAIVRVQVARLGRGTDTAVGIVDNQRVLLGQQRRGDVAALVCAGVPGVGAERLKGHVLGQSEGARGEAARGQDVDGRRRGLQAGVVPDPGDKVADLVELQDGGRGGGDHGDATGRIDGVEGGVGGLGGAVGSAGVALLVGGGGLASVLAGARGRRLAVGLVGGLFGCSRCDLGARVEVECAVGTRARGLFRGDGG